MMVLVACEESQRVCEAFRRRGHEAYSADIQEPSGGHPDPRKVYASGVSMPSWYSNAPKNERAKVRSKTFRGIARAMAEQWG